MDGVSRGIIPNQLPQASGIAGLKETDICVSVKGVFNNVIHAADIQNLGKQPALLQPKISGVFTKSVTLDVQTKNGTCFRVSVKVDDLAKLLGVSPKAIKAAVQENTLYTQFGAPAPQTSGVEKGKTKETASFTPPSFPQLSSAKLAEFGLTEADYTQATQWCSKHADLLQGSETVHINKEAFPGELSRSLVYIPSGPEKGIYVLAKSKGGVKEVGVGYSGRATVAMNLETGGGKVFRTSHAKDVSKSEIKALSLVSSKPEFFAAGAIVRYKGALITRQRPSGVEKDRLPKQQGVDKVGVMMEHQKGGALLSRLGSTRLAGSLSVAERKEVAVKAARGLVELHKLGVVHRDLKPENVFLSAAGDPKLADFGHAAIKGEIFEGRGSPGYRAPELMNNGPGCADKPVDIWSLGCMLANMKEEPKNGSWWTDRVRDVERQNNAQGVSKFLQPGALDSDLMSFFPNWEDPTHIDSVILQCLEFRPEQRPTAEQLEVLLRNVTSFSQN